DQNGSPRHGSSGCEENLHWIAIGQPAARPSRRSADSRRSRIGRRRISGGLRLATLWQFGQVEPRAGGLATGRRTLRRALQAELDGGELRLRLPLPRRVGQGRVLAERLQG